MIPDQKILKKRCDKQKICIESNSYFKLAEEYVILESLFSVELFDFLFIILDMVIYPIYVIIKLYNLEHSPMFIIGLMKTYQLWTDWFRYQELKFKILEWKITVKKLGGPWISTNDPTYHVYVYADAMERLSLTK